jgi:hypothetical protein
MFAPFSFVPSVMQILPSYELKTWGDTSATLPDVFEKCETFVNIRFRM